MNEIELIKFQFIEYPANDNQCSIHLLIILWGILLLLRTSGWLVRFILNFVYDIRYADITKRKLIYYDTLSGAVPRRNLGHVRDYTGTLIGKCENVLIFIFIIFDQYTALALIFTAKTIVRAESMRADPLYYLVGTLINVTYSIIIAILIKYLINII